MTTISVYLPAFESYFEVYYAEWMDNTGYSFRIWIEHPTAGLADVFLNSSYTADVTALVTAGVFFRPMKPSEFHSWDDVNEEWLLDQLLFTPYLISEITNYRIQKIVVPVSYDNGTTTYTVTNTDQTRLDMLTISAGIDAADELSEPIGTIDFDGDDDWSTMTATDARHLFLELFKHQQKCYSAARHVEELHAVTPYTDTTLATAKADFDAYLAGL